MVFAATAAQNIAYCICQIRETDKVATEHLRGQQSKQTAIILYSLVDFSVLLYHRANMSAALYTVQVQFVESKNKKP